MVRRGSTMVPLRFVSGSLGVDVRCSEANQLVSIFTNGAPNPEPKPTTQTVDITLGTVVPVTLDEALSPLPHKVGDTFSVTVRSMQNGDAEFPLGTHFAQAPW